MKSCILLFLCFLALCLGIDPRCSQPIDQGICYGHVPKFAFDNSVNDCIPFVYGGCLGNDNQFDTYEECRAAC